MKIQLNFNSQSASSSDLVVLGAYSKTSTKGKKEDVSLVTTNWSKELKDSFSSFNTSSDFKGAKGTNFLFSHEGTQVIAVGMGEKSKINAESLRKQIAKLYKKISSEYKSASFQIDTLILKSSVEKTIGIISESLQLTSYSFDKYKTKSKKASLQKIILDTKEKKTKLKKSEAALERSTIITESVNLCRDLVNEPPNVLNSETYAKLVEKDAQKIKNVKIKILGKNDLKKQKMGMFLSVNAGSNYDPRLVHLTYTPKKVTKKTKHIALVGKGLTFDTGGYSLKPGGSMINMKFDMGGSSTVYGAFRAAAKLGLDVKISCFLGMTDNAVNEKATMPDSIVTARNGKTVEILNTDAEGRLVLGDVLDYACDQKPDVVIDAATLTGAVLVSLGSEVCGLMGNDQKLADKLLKASKEVDEYMWQLPIINEFREDMKSRIADLKNIGGTRFGGSSKAAAFLENFVQEGVSWAHLDIAGIGDSQSHLPYCPAKGGSGIIVRTLVQYLENA